MMEGTPDGGRRGLHAVRAGRRGRLHHGRPLTAAAGPTSASSPPVTTSPTPGCTARSPPCAAPACGRGARPRAGRRRAAQEPRCGTWTRGGMVSRGLRALSPPAAGPWPVCCLALDPDSALGALLVAPAWARPVVADVHEDYTALLRDRAWARVRRAGRTRGGQGRGPLCRAGRPDGRRGRAPATDGGRRPGAAGGAQPAGHGARARLGGPRHRSSRRRDRARSTSATCGPLGACARWWRPWPARRGGGSTSWVPCVRVDADWLASRVAEPDLDGRVGVHGRMPPARAWAVARGADVGLVLLDDTPVFRDAVPSKAAGSTSPPGLAVLATPLPRRRGPRRRVGGRGAGHRAGRYGVSPARVGRAPRPAAGHRRRTRAPGPGSICGGERVLRPRGTGACSWRPSRDRDGSPSRRRRPPKPAFARERRSWRGSHAFASGRRPGRATVPTQGRREPAPVRPSGPDERDTRCRTTPCPRATHPRPAPPPGPVPPAIQGLRAAAVLLVVLFHLWPHRLSGGTWASTSSS